MASNNISINIYYKARVSANRNPIDEVDSVKPKALTLRKHFPESWIYESIENTMGYIDSFLTACIYV